LHIQSERSITAYDITLIKKSGIYDNDNGKKTEYYDDKTIKSEYNLLNGKFNGAFKFYHENGNIQKISKYSNDILSGKVIEYDENGSKSAEYNVSNDKKNGLLTYFENNKISYTANYKEDMKNGLYTGFYYDDTTNNLYSKEIGQFINNEKNGTWTTYYIDGKTAKTINYTNYLKDIKEGQFQEAKGDSLIVGNYKSGKLNGNYKVYIDFKKSIIGGIINTNIPDLKLTEEGQYKDGKKVGFWKNYTLSGSLSAEGNYIEDLEDGEWNFYNPNYIKQNGNPETYAKKIITKETYLSGKLNGKAQRFYYKEEIKYPCNEVDGNGVKMDSCSKFIFHKINETSYYKDGELNGNYELRDSINQLILKGQHVNDVREGKWFAYNRGNIIKKESNYKLGLLHGEVIEYNDSYKPINLMQFELGKLKQLIVNDSLGIKRNFEYDIIKRTDDYLKVNQTEYLNDGMVLKEYWLKNDTKNDDNFELNFLIKTYKESDGSLGYTDGEFLMTTLNYEPIIKGKLYKENKIDTWTFYYYDQNVKIEKKYIDNAVIEELYLKLDNSLFSGEFEHVDDEKNVKEVRKIKEGLRNGKTIYINLKTNKTVNKEDYKGGKLKE
jgi:antitoxin component YwqK of YwqJK toxin-antitoxin module